MGLSPSRIHRADRLAVKERADVVDHTGEIRPVVLQRDVAEMWREHDVVELAQGVIDRQRLGVEHVQSGAGDCLVAQDRKHCALVDDRPARGVDDVGRGLHQREFLRAHEAAAALRQHHVDGDEIRLPEQILLAHIPDTGLLALLGGEVLAPGDHLHPERLRDLGDALPELAQAEHAERQSFEVEADGRLPAHARLHARVLVADAPGELEHEPDGDARGRTADGRGPAHHHVALLGGGDIDRSIAHAGGDEELEIRELLDHRARKSGALAHGADDLEALQRLDHVIGVAEMLAEHLDLEVLCDLRPIGRLEGNVLVVVEDRATGHDGFPWFAEGKRPLQHTRNRAKSSRAKSSRAKSSRAKPQWLDRPVPSFCEWRATDQRFTRTGASAGIASKASAGRSTMMRSCLACQAGPGPRM